MEEERNKIKIKIKCDAIKDSLDDNLSFKQKLAVALVIPNQLYDFKLYDFEDYLILSVDEEYKDKALKLLERFNREVLIL